MLYASANALLRRLPPPVIWIIAGHAVEQLALTFVRWAKFQFTV